MCNMASTLQTALGETSCAQLRRMQRQPSRVNSGTLSLLTLSADAQGQIAQGQAAASEERARLPLQVTSSKGDELGG